MHLLSLFNSTGATNSLRFRTGIARSSIIQPKLIIACNDQHGNYNISSPERFRQCIDEVNGFNKTQTSNPLLFTTNRIDPVASSAHKMSAFSQDSVVLAQDAVGHGLQVAVSECTTNHSTKFMETGELPPPDTLCPVK
ncbi:hypothetical protein V2W45_1339882, partial [Cenococcum geophilum]